MRWDDREGDVHRGAGQRAGLALGGGQDAVDRQAVERRVGAEPTGRAQQVRERLAFFQLVDRRAEHGARDLDAPAVQRHVHDVARLESDVSSGRSAQQVVVQVERRGERIEAAHLDVPHVGAPGHAAGGVQRREGRAERADLIGAGLLHLAEHRDLVDSHPRDRDVKVSRGAGAAREFRVHAPEACIQHVAQLAEGEVRDEHLSHLRDQDEPFTGDRERIGALDVAREDEDELVARAERVVRRNGAGERRQELSGGATEHVHAKHVVSGGQRFGAH